METEIWEPISGYEGFYEVSNFGRVKSLCAGKWRTEAIRKLVLDKDGYFTVCLKKDGVVKNMKVHRLVASAFIPNPEHYPEVNHKNEIRNDNRVDNLEWCTSRYNQTYHDKHLKLCKPVCKIDDFGNVIGVYSSVNDAAASVGVTASHMSTVLSGRRKRNTRAGGFRWKFMKGATANG